MAATEMLCSHSMFSGLDIERSAGAKRNCLTAKAMTALCTGRWPRRVIAVRKSIKCFPAGLNAAEFATCSSRAASRGSVPTIFTISDSRTLGSARALRMRMTTSGKEGRLTVPFDTSAARPPRNASAEERSCSLATAFFAEAGVLRFTVDIDATFAISIVVQELRTVGRSHSGFRLPAPNLDRIFQGIPECSKAEQSTASHQICDFTVGPPPSAGCCIANRPEDLPAPQPY